MTDPLGSVEKIIKVALSIKEAVKTVRKNKEQCREIRKRVLRVSALLKRLQETEMIQDPAMCDALEALEETLTRTHDLIVACQKKNIMCRLCMAGDLAKQLREVKQDNSDQMVDGIFAANVSATIILTSIQYVAGPLSLKNAGAVDISQCRHSTYDNSCELINHSKNNVPVRSMSQPAPFSCLTHFSLSELETATNGFSDENLIGRGGFVSVYKGVLHDGLVVAIKRFRNSIIFSWDHLYDELNLVSKLQHKNLVKLLGYGYQDIQTVVWAEDRNDQAERRLYFSVEEHMPNGNLEENLKVFRLDWLNSIRIIQGIAHGLNYLHMQHIVHSDLKPSNMLLDFHLNPKISDFGMARMLDHGDMTTRDVNCLAGTMGYMPPEYIVEGILSTKYDVYSFGVILLEIISSMCILEPVRRQASVEWAWEVWRVGSLKDRIVQSLCIASEQEKMQRYMEVGLLCTQFNPADRPTMADTLQMLNGKKELPTPRKPRYTKKRTVEGVRSVALSVPKNLRL
ncbi:unnamed protein product [Urochloa decumbens]|uniref:Protein kinase domain-containing protein n=1 Tax=Urochloa decumbens TaxID=240449 RepID=A0ABC9AJI6_9POAL